MPTQSLTDGLEKNTCADWHPHPSFRGVEMKTLVSGVMTGGRLSQHFVRVVFDCALELHAHSAQCELHLVIEGQAVASLEDQEITYSPGQITAIPVGKLHAVRARSEGITLLASFTPALT